MNETITLELMKTTAYNPSLIILWALMLAIFPFVAWIYKSKKTDWGKFASVWLFTAILSGTLLLFLTNYPDIVNKFIEGIRGFFGF